MQIMVDESPLRKLHEEYAESLRAWARQRGESGEMTADAMLEAEVEYLPYGTASTGDEAGGPLEIPATWGLVEAEYAAIRRAAGLLDLPQRATILVRGTDRRDFLNRMVTQELKDLRPGVARRAFWLNRKGRIEADLLIIEREDETLIDVDVLQAKTVVDTLSEFLFTEDVTLENVSEDWHRFALYGPRSMEVIGAIAGQPDFALDCLSSQSIDIGETSVDLIGDDTVGEPGILILVRRGDAADLWRRVIASDATLGEGKRRIRPIGWYAFNIARIEAGTPVMNIDFGSESLPHETGVLRSRVSFTKGCFLGQEIVARMEHLGKPKQTLVGLRVEGDALPVAGAQVFEDTEAGGMGDQVGVVTSSTLSPMLGAAPIAFAMVRTKHAGHGTRVIVNAEGTQSNAIAQDRVFWTPGRPAEESATTERKG